MNNEPISFLILATLPDHGIKSLGSKSLLKLKNKYIIEHQLNSIKSACKNIDHEIILLTLFDNQRVCRHLSQYEKSYNLQIIKQDADNLNFGGAFIDGLKYAKYDKIISINYGCLFNKKTISSLIKSKQNNICITPKHKYNDNIKIECFIEQQQIVNIFFDIGKDKYLDINLWNQDTIRYIKKHFHFSLYRNKFMFEIVNNLLAHGFTFVPNSLDPKDCLFIDNLNIFTKSKRIFTNEKTTNKKT